MHPCRPHISCSLPEHLHGCVSTAFSRLLSADASVEVHCRLSYGGIQRYLPEPYSNVLINITSCGFYFLLQIELIILSERTEVCVSCSELRIERKNRSGRYRKNRKQYDRTNATKDRYDCI